MLLILYLCADLKRQKKIQAQWRMYCFELFSKNERTRRLIYEKNECLFILAKSAAAPFNGVYVNVINHLDHSVKIDGAARKEILVSIPQ